MPHIPDFPESLIRKLLNDMTRDHTQIQVAMVTKAMELEAPDVAALGFENYRSMLAMDTEGRHTMVMLEREPGQPCQPIICIVTSFPDLDISPMNPKAGIMIKATVEPIVGEDGWQAFQQERARNNMRD